MTQRTPPPRNAPVLSMDELAALGHRILEMSSTENTKIAVAHTVRNVTRLANGEVLSSDDGDEIKVGITGQYGGRAAMSVYTNQLDDLTLRAVIDRLEDVARQRPGGKEPLLDIPVQQREIPHVATWKESTAAAMTEVRDTVLPVLLEPARRENFFGAGYLGFMARSSFVQYRTGLTAFHRETDCECTVSVRSLDGKASGWAGQADRDWMNIAPATIAADAVERVRHGVTPQALEPGRRVVILSPDALVQIFRFMPNAFHAFNTDVGKTPFSKSPYGGLNKLGKQVFDARLSIYSDPNDPLGGYQPFYGPDDYDGVLGVPTPPMRWIERGVLENLSYSVPYGLQKGKPYAPLPWSMHVAPVSGTPTQTVEEMIASCQEGIYVNRFSGVDMVDTQTGMLTGVTRDGCFLVKNGKIDRAIKNLRFTDSPFVFLNNIVSIGVARRATFGYTPRNRLYDAPGSMSEWPRCPMILPPMMIRDFNFTALSDAV